ncbi:DDE-type integrase/transposase/recombinase [Arcobacter sp. L]|uniref:DDE-type integrase/transposase/recombinase n=1 Tax=Arcobacter sp. L TaxID=944547 RepID=UPI0002296474|nr:DDE-type integrase/transposase/recombinase [Arcobacter sp. L]BAK73724.1 phage DNA transposition protein [Arcobacter sp. L]
MEFTAKDLIEKLNLTKMALSKALKNIPFESKKLDTSTKPVKHYKYDDLPERYKEKLKELGIVKEEEKVTNISKTNFKAFTKKYLLASSEKQEKALKKLKFIEFYFKKDISVSQGKFIENTLKNSIEFDILGNISLKQLNDWIRTYKEAKAKGENLVEAFVDGRGKEKNTTALTIEQQQMAERYFLKQSHPIIRTIHLLMCSHFGSTMPSYDALNNFYKRWKKANPQLFMFSKSPDKWKNYFLIALGNESEKALYRNHFWEFDATPADVICKDGKRYTILGLIDIATRRPIFKVEDSNSVFAVTRLLRAGILKFGIPENIVIDNGKEFISNHFASVCANLEIMVHTTPPFSGDKKPFIERMFGTLARGLFRYIPAFIGHNVAMNSEIKARESFAHKIMSIKKANEEIKNKDEEDAFRELWRIKKENIGIDINIALYKDELQEIIDLWTERIYEQKEHGGLNKSPINAWNSYPTPVQSIGDERMLDLLLGKSYKAKVGKKGIRMDNCTYWHDELFNYMGKTVKVMTNDNLGEVIAYDPETMQLICKAIDLEYYGISRETAASARKQQNKIVQQFNKAIKMAEEADDPTLIDVIKAKEKYEISYTLATTKRTTVTTMLLNESHKLQEQDKAELETSKHYDFKNKDEDGKPKKVLEGRRPEFETYEDRFLWCLEKNEWNEKDKKLKELKPDSYKRAFEKYEKRRLA